MITTGLTTWADHDGHCHQKCYYYDGDNACIMIPLHHHHDHHNRGDGAGFDDAGDEVMISNGLNEDV